MPGGRRHCRGYSPGVYQATGDALSLSWIRRVPWNVWVAVVMLTACAAVWVGTVERTQYEYAAPLREAGKQNSNLAIALEEHSIRSLTAVDEGLTLMSRAYLRDGPRVEAHG